MDNAYFVSRNDILKWINTTLKLDLVKIEQTASGIIALQLIDIIHPSAVQMHKIKWNAKQE